MIHNHSYVVHHQKGICINLNLRHNDIDERITPSVYGKVLVEGHRRRTCSLNNGGYQNEETGIQAHHINTDEGGKKQDHDT